MRTLQILSQQLKDAKERSDLPIEDFVGWDGYIDLLNSHIEALEMVEQLEKEVEEITEDRNTWRSNSLDWNGEEDENKDEDEED